MTLRINHWRFEDGQVRRAYEGRGQYSMHETVPRGWYCWVYPDDDQEFEEWMKKNCPSADFTHRFNSGDPMYTVFIREDSEATLFQLKWT